MAAYILDRFPAAVRAMAARCKLSFALRPSLAQENDDRIKVKTKETTKIRIREWVRVRPVGNLLFD